MQYMYIFECCSLNKVIQNIISFLRPLQKLNLVQIQVLEVMVISTICNCPASVKLSFQKLWPFPNLQNHQGLGHF